MSDQDIQKYEKMLVDDPRSRAFAPLAEAYRKAGNLDDAIRVAQAGLEIHPGYTGGLVVLGRALYEKKELDKAADVLRKAVSETPESYLGQKFLGKVLMERGENLEALKALEAANHQSPDDGEVIELLEKVRPKAEPGEVMAFPGDKGEGDAGKARIVTYEQKPTTVDGLELDPLPASLDEETFSFSDVQEEKEKGSHDIDAELEDIEDLEVVEDVGEMEVAEGSDNPAAAQEGLMGDLGPEAASFIEEADNIDVTTFGVADEELDQEDEAGEDPFSIEELMGAAADEPGEDLPVSPSSGIIDHAVIGKPAFTPPAAPGPEATVPSPVGDPAGETTPAKPSEAAEPPVTAKTKETAFPVSSQRKDDAPVEHAPVKTAAPVTPPSAGTPPGHSGSAGDISTETLADLYATQGLAEKAAEIYRQILRERPTDQGVLAKLRDLEEIEGTPPRSVSPTAEIPPTGAPSADNGDALAILESWLQNAERMKRK